MSARRIPLSIFLVLLWTGCAVTASASGSGLRHRTSIVRLLPGRTPAIGFHTPANVVSPRVRPWLGAQSALGAATEGTGGWSVLRSPNPVGPAGQLLATSCWAPGRCQAVGTFATASGTSAVLAERRDDGGWHAEPISQPVGAAFATLQGVSCSSSSDCMAVGWDWTAPGRVATLAEHWDGSGWQVMTTPNPPGVIGSLLAGVSCTSPSACMAVGNPVGDSAFVGAGTLAEQWDGTRWTIIQSPQPAGGYMNAVTCLSGSSCVAVGGDSEAGASPLLILRWDGASWRSEPAPLPRGSSAGFLSGVACPSERECWAVGNHDSAGVGNRQVLVEHWDGRRWTAEAAPDPVGATFDALIGAECFGPSSCVAVGASDGATLAERWDGGHWQLERSETPVGAGDSVLVGVSCPASACIATGMSDFVPLAETRVAAGWAAEPSAAATGAAGAQLQGVACTSAARCMAVGDAADLDGNPQAALTERWDGSRWTLLATPDPSAHRAGLLVGIACLSPSSCTAVGGAGDGSGATPATLAEHWDGLQWTIQPTPTPAGADQALLVGVACPSVHTCVAVGFTADSTGAATGTLAERWDGRAWSIVKTPNPGSPGAILTGVTCLSEVRCVAVGFAADGTGTPAGTLVEQYDGQAWSIVPSPNPDGGSGSAFNSVACTSAATCLAVGGAFDAAGNPTGTLAEQWDGTRWTVMPPSSDTGPGAFLNSVSCVSAQRCTAAGLELTGFPPAVLAEQWDGTAWRTQPTPQLPFTYDIDPPAVACPVATNCMLVAGYTNNGPKLSLAELWSTG